MWLQWTKGFCRATEINQQNEKTIYRIGEYICKSYTKQEILIILNFNFNNFPKYKINSIAKKKKSNLKKIGKASEKTFSKEVIHKWLTY